MASRRKFLTRVGQSGGFSAAFVTMRALGLMPVERSASPLSLAPTAGAGVRVVILGGGIAGLVSAYEMRKAGFACTVLEARSRPGGRNWTVRNGWESKRFWETECNIYGGISFIVGGPVGLVWYPSARLFSDTGVLISGYAAEGDSAFSKLGSLHAKLAASRAAVEQLHPGWGRWLSRPIYVNWGKIAHNEGSWVGREPGLAERDPNAAVQVPNAAAERTAYYDGPYNTFLEPDDRPYFAGDHCARVGAWQEGAALSAHRTVQMICERV